MKKEQFAFDLGHRAAFAREDFWVSESNRIAVDWLDKWPDWPAPLLLIYGAAACGKTHLLQVFRQETSAWVYAPGKQPAESDRTVIIDDLDQRMTAPDQAEEVLHLYNVMKERGGHILAAATTAQRHWQVPLPDLKSRLMAAPAVELGSPDDQLMAVVLSKLFSDRQIFVSQDVVAFILARIERSFAALRDIVERVDQRALAEKRAVTIPLVRDILQDSRVK